MLKFSFWQMWYIRLENYQVYFHESKSILAFRKSVTKTSVTVYCHHSHHQINRWCRLGRARHRPREIFTRLQLQNVK